MQYPQIQFYRGSLVRLASGKLKQVEDLSSEDFVESARLVSKSSNSLTPTSPGLDTSSQIHLQQHNQQQFNYIFSNKHSQLQQVNNNGRTRNGHLDENNNSVFNSPEPTSGHFDSSTMDMDEDEEVDATIHHHHHNNNNHEDDYDEDNEDIDVELDVVTNYSSTSDSTRTASEQLMRSNSNSQKHRAMRPVDNTTHSPSASILANNNHHMNYHLDTNEADDFYIDSSVVRDFLEVGPPSSTSPTSSTNSLNPDHLPSMPPTSSSTLSSSSSSSASSSSSSSSSLVISPPVANATTTAGPSQTVLIKFFLETSRSVAFIEVPIEHPFFVFHRGWSSWNPQRTYDKFGLKCRKLKIEYIKLQPTTSPTTRLHHMTTSVVVGNNSS